MSEDRPRARRGPNWTMVYVLLGLALLAFIISGLSLVARPTLVNWTARSGLTAARQWRPMTGTHAVTGPEHHVVPETGEIEVTITYATDNGSRINTQDLTIFCGMVPVPSGWTLWECLPVDGYPDQYVVSIRH